MDDLVPPAPVVVGVDGSTAGESAVDHAIECAARTGRPLRLVTAIAEALIPLDMRARTLDGEWQLLRDHEKAALDRHPDLDCASELVAGDAIGVLLDRSAKGDRLVVGKRGLGPFARMLLGSTSTGVAGRSTVPVVVVPSGAPAPEQDDRPVVVGVDLEDSTEVLRAGFRAAAEHGCALEAVHAIDLAPQLAWDALSAPTYQRWQDVDQALVEDRLAALREEFPTVDAMVSIPRGDVATVLLDRAREARLLVLGRGDRHRYGLGFGSRTRAVLHYAETPVMIVPPGD